MFDFSADAHSSAEADSPGTGRRFFPFRTLEDTMSHRLQLPPELENHLSLMTAEAEAIIGQAEDQTLPPRSLHPDAAAFLSLLTRVAGAKRILEIGTSVGFSTLYLADAVRQTGGHITSVELLLEKSEKARRNLSAAGLAEHVALRTGDVREIGGQLTGPWDLLFIDLEKELYLPVWRMLSGEVRVGGLVVADNVVSHAEDLAEFIEAVHSDRRYESVSIPVGMGLELARRLR
jgi:predicted O-methyltransferase YrrM